MGASPLWFDSHCHVPYLASGASRPAGPGEAQEAATGLADPESVLAEARAAGVSRFVSVGTDAAQSRAALDVARSADDVWATVGLHPHDAKEGVESIIPVLADGLADGACVAIGECGLDYHYDHSPRDVQRAAFAAQIAMAHEHDLALVIHTREAWEDTWDILRAERVPQRTVFHCFTGGAAEAQTCLDLGASLSFSGIVTFKTADDVRAAASLCPLDRLLVETDAPYLAPVPHRGRTNTPGLVPVVGEALAALRGVDAEAIATTTWDNASRLFGLPTSSRPS